MTEGYWCTDDHTQGHQQSASIHYHPPVREAGTRVTPPPDDDPIVITVLQPEDKQYDWKKKLWGEEWTDGESAG